jgi:O-antigen ligase
MSSAVVVAPAVENIPAQKARPDRLQSAVLFGVFGLLLLGPLAFGAVEPWAIFTLEAGAVLLFALWVIRQATTGELQIAGNRAFPPMLAFGALIILQLALRQTAYRAATVSASLLYCSYGLLCFLVVQCLRRTWQVRTAAIAFSLYGFMLATFALIQALAFNGKLYWIRTPRFGGWIYGPYVNHNHYAGLIEMLFPVPLVIFLSPRAQRPHKTMAALAAGMMASTIFLCGSRGGMFAFVVQIVVLSAVLISRRERRKMVLALSAFLLVAFVLLAWVGGEELVDRMTSVSKETRTELSGGTRLSIDRDCLKMFAQEPLVGWGLGVFPEVYPQFRSFYTNFLIDKAHNDYLQFLVETGTIGFALMVWFLFSVCRAAIRKVKAWPTDVNAEVALAALLGVTGILVHSFMDFNLQIPANAALFFVLCVVASMDLRFGLHRSGYRYSSAA